jgi:hypothetical protein
MTYDYDALHRVKRKIMALAASLLLVLTFATASQAQTPIPAHAGIFDGDIREAIAELREVRKANQEVAAESREWRGILSRFDGSRIGAFVDRIATLIWLVFWVLIVALCAWALRELASVVKAAGDALKAFRREESE